MKNLNLRRIFITLLVLLLPVLYACDFKHNIQIYFSDVKKLAAGKGKGVIFAKMKITLPQNEKKCPKEKQKLFKILKKYYFGASGAKCVKEGFSTVLALKARAPIVLAGKKGPKALISFVVTPGTSPSVELKMNKKMFSKLDAEIQKVYYQNIKAKNIKINLRLVNDGSGSASFTAYSSFVDGKAVPMTKSFKLDGREEAKVKLSEILINFIHAKGRHKILDIQ